MPLPLQLRREATVCGSVVYVLREIKRLHGDPWLKLAGTRAAKGPAMAKFVTVALLGFGLACDCVPNGV
jgi:hypothetical protein